MRILHFADLHIGVENYGRVDPATGLSTRLQDFLNALDQLVEYAVSSDIDLVLFAGDAYKSRDPSQTQQREFAQRIARLTAAGVPVFLVVGNHDLPYAAGRATALDIYPTLGVPLVTVGKRIGTEMVRVRGGGLLQVVVVPWINRSWLLTQEDFKNLPLDAINQVMEEKLNGLLRLQFEALDAKVPAVLAGHLAHTEAVPGSERRMTVGADPVFLPSTLTGSRGGTAAGAGALDYCALGHIHKMQVYQNRVPVVYSGSVQRIDFGEEGQDKGFYVIDIDPTRPLGDRLRSFDFHPVQARTFTTIEVTSRSGNPTEDVLRAIQRRASDVTEAIVRVRVRLPAGQEALLDDAAVRRALAPAHYLAGILREPEGSVRSRLGDVHIESLAPLGALELYLRSKETPDERARQLLDVGRQVIAEVNEGQLETEVGATGISEQPALGSGGG
ncbi:MAG: exonuclease SbcCD subunit D [Dehalococcoidia bacterium]|nr:exonuclease SbcCD subunit D [Dehalococcoidia bacterium]